LVEHYCFWGSTPCGLADIYPFIGKLDLFDFKAEEIAAQEG
jgi:hypothetical protein